MDGLMQERQPGPQVHTTNTKSNQAISHSFFTVKHTAEFHNRHTVFCQRGAEGFIFLSHFELLKNDLNKFPSC